MIKAIIFDLGNVLINWKPADYLKNAGYKDTEISLILKDVFHSEEWLKLDNGDITTPQAIKIIAKKSTLSESEIRAIFDLRLKIISPIHNNAKLLPELKKRGYRLYYLSNFPDDIFDEVKNKYNFFMFFDGGEISARLNASKPDKRIFRIFLDKYMLKPEESLFIDDSDINAGAAEKLGIKAIHLDSPEVLKEKLEEALGIKLKIS
ncbi:MAG TPA: HAD family phosphatase [Bacteroidales bacterium]|nr:HAD family phosphatase [Bacteroidales bacterium]HOK73979.1 HAD family phosphatase [Bacteroidales bacterium]HOM40850.1 HAD family phosphatase [Bacteroidales bacterium]HOU30516.1 HAD family phosphatase [Bacteroidales bacterium]HPP91802.1 HAD family phosphatase [Bacteroidales bacterium]